MDRRVTAAGVLLLLLGSTAGLGQREPKPGAEDPTITDQELRELLELLDESQDGLLNLLTGLTDEQWTFRETPERWSIGECVEHIVRSQQASLESVRRLAASAPDPDWAAKTRGKTALLRRYVPDPRPQGQGGVQAPQEIRPTEGWGRSHGIRELYSSYGQARAYIETMDRAVKDRTSQSSVELFGWLNAYHQLVNLPLHAMRHGKQIERIREHPDYPAEAAPVATASDRDPRLSKEEMARLIRDVDGAQETLLGLVTGLTDEQWVFRENPDRWSIGECVEHIARTLRATIDGLELAFLRPPNPNWYEETQGKNDLVRRAVLTRNPGGAGSPFKAPGEVAPTQDWDRARAFHEIYQALGRLRAYVETMPADIKSRTMTNPFPELGVLNGYDWLTLTALHVVRHSRQIAEIKADAGFPG